MTAPQIPNLLDGLRASRIARGNSSRSHARENLSSFRSPQARREPSAPSADAIVQQTDDDAAGSRLSAVEAGYLQDDFARVFAPPGMQVGVRRMPVINRGVCSPRLLVPLNNHLKESSGGRKMVELR